MLISRSHKMYAFLPRHGCLGKQTLNPKGYPLAIYGKLLHVGENERATQRGCVLTSSMGLWEGFAWWDLAPRRSC
jgi:hypothetical protein